DLRPDAIVITHEHSDHFHEPTLRLFDRGTAIYVPDFPNQRLQRRLAALGVRNVVPLRFGDPCDLHDGWRATTVEPPTYWNDGLSVRVTLLGVACGSARVRTDDEEKYCRVREGAVCRQGRRGRRSSAG